MTVLEQFLAQLNSLENEEVKAPLLESFKAVESVFGETIQRRDSVSETNRSLTDKIKSFETTLGLSEGYDMNDVKALLNSDKDLEKLKGDLESKYNNDITQLRDALNSKENDFNELNNRYNDSIFKNEVVNSGLLGAFIDEPMARNMITGLIKEKTIFKDGNIYAKDSTTGDIAKDIKTGESLKLESVVNEIKSTISPVYLAAQTNTNGGGMTPSSNGGGKGNKISDYSIAELKEMKAKNPQQYEALQKKV